MSPSDEYLSPGMKREKKDHERLRVTQCCTGAQKCASSWVNAWGETHDSDAIHRMGPTMHAADDSSMVPTYSRTMNVNVCATSWRAIVSKPERLKHMFSCRHVPRHRIR